MPDLDAQTVWRLRASVPAGPGRHCRWHFARRSPRLNTAQSRSTPDLAPRRIAPTPSPWSSTSSAPCQLRASHRPRAQRGGARRRCQAPRRSWPSRKVRVPRRARHPLLDAHQVNRSAKVHTHAPRTYTLSLASRVRRNFGPKLIYDMRGDPAWRGGGRQASAGCVHVPHVGLVGHAWRNSETLGGCTHQPHR